jgi:hypothetical protein
MPAMKPREYYIALLLFGAAAAVGMLYPATWGGTPHFFQELFGPAVMFACGNGWANPVDAEAPALQAFLHPAMHVNHPPAISTCDCDSLPSDLSTAPWSSFQQRQRYLIYAAGMLWRIFGVSWAALAPLYGLFYGLSTVALYALFRLGMGRPIAITTTLLLIFSPIQLNNLLRLRDYSKAPFILLAIALTAWMLLHARTPRRLMAVAAAMGLLTGVGVGFRMDVLIVLPAFAVAVACFAPPTAGSRRLRAAAILLCAAIYYAVSWPVTHALDTGMKYQDFLLGLNDLYDSRLGVGGAPYQIGHRYFDREPMAILQAHAPHATGTQALYEFDTHEYEAIGRAYSMTILTTFPADLALRALAAVLRTIDELTFSTDHAVPKGITGAFSTWCFESLAMFAAPAFRYARYAVLLALLVLAGRNLRLAFAAFFLLLYFGGYGAIQFASRHYFHLQFLGVWAVGFLTWQAWNLFRAIRSSGGLSPRWKMHAPALPGAVNRAALFACLATIGILISLQGLRVWQSSRVTPLLQAVQQAPRVPAEYAAVPDNEGMLIQAAGHATAGVEAADAPPSFSVDYWVAEFDTSQGPVTPTLRYRGAVPDLALTWATVLPATASGTTQLIFPAYTARWKGEGAGWTRYEGIWLATAEAPQLMALSRIPDTEALPLLLTWTLPPEVDSQPLHQRLIR